MASKTFANDYSLYKSGGNFYRDARYPNSYVVTDTYDGPGDDVTQLGDIQGDRFSATSSAGTYTGTYIGKTPNGFVELNNDGVSYNLYTNGAYASDAPIVFDRNAALLLCFVGGTMVRTVQGDRPVEELRIGDLAATASGEHRPIRWIGHRDVKCASLPSPYEAHPVRILAGAFGGGLPERDLFLSPGHPVLVGEGDSAVLVPIMCLINGTSIARVPVERVTYWHVELDQHDILLAEGLPAESFLDFGNRPWFENGADHALANPDFIPPGLNGRCRPVAIDGPVVDAERRRLDALFEMSLADQCGWPSQEEAWAGV